MLVVSCEGRHLIDLGSSNVTRINTANATPFHVNFEHDLRRPFAIHGKKFLQHKDHELHRGEVVVEQHDRVERRRSELAAFGFEYGAFLIRFCHEPILTSLFSAVKRVNS